MATEILATGPMVRQKLDETSETKRVGFVAPESWVRRIDEWRRRHPDLPNQSEAIRMLVDQALSADEAKRG